MDNMNDKIENSLNKLNNINNWISNCDSKSSYILTFLGVVITIIFTSSIGEQMISCLKFVSSEKTTFQSCKAFFQLVLFILFIISIIITFYFTYFTLKARIDPNVYNQADLITNSNLFFGSICTKKFKDFNHEIKNETEENFLNDINSQIFINSHIANLKFKNYNRSLLFSIITFSIFLIYIFIK